MIRKFAVITGASRGLGAELAKAFSNANYDIFLIARSLDMLKKVKSSLNNDNVIIKECDLSQPTEIENLISEIKIHFEKIDVIINNAASHGPIGPFFENDIDAWENVFRLNLFAPMRLCFGLKENLRKSDFPSIINISGGGATGPRENLSAYATSKAGLVRFTETLAMELREEGIKVNAIAPGAMKTSLLKEVYDHGPDVTGKKEYLVAKDKFKSEKDDFGKATDLALFLASKESLGITGKLVSAVWDDWKSWSMNIDQLEDSDLYTLRRITARDKGLDWGDK